MQFRALSNLKVKQQDEQKKIDYNLHFLKKAQKSKGSQEGDEVVHNTRAYTSSFKDNALSETTQKVSEMYPKLMTELNDPDSQIPAYIRF